MKKIALFAAAALLLSCSKDDNNNTNTETETGESYRFTAFDYSNFDVSGGLMNSTRYSLNNEGKIVGYSNTTDNGTYNFNTDGLITSVEKFENNQITSRTQYQYSSQDLDEIVIEDYTASGTTYTKIEYDYAQNDTIFVTQRGSSDGITYDIDISDSKIVLDSNGNRVYFENYYYSSDGTRAVVSQYDSENNLTNETYFSDLGNGFEEDFSNTISYSNALNSLYHIYETTYTKKFLMLTYHLESSILNQVNAKNISPKNVTSFSTSFGGQFSFELQSEIGDDNYATKNIYKTFANSDLIRHFEYSFITE